MFRKVPQLKHIAFVTGLSAVGSQAMMYKYKKAINVEERPHLNTQFKFFSSTAMSDDGKDKEKPFELP